jgi:hypothetical protein
MIEVDVTALLEITGPRKDDNGSKR